MLVLEVGGFSILAMEAEGLLALSDGQSGAS